MTKMKSRKMTKSTFAIIIMAIAMIAMLAFGGTYAYFTATATEKEFTGLKTGLIKLEVGDIQITTNNFVPGDYLVGSAQTTAPIKYTESSTADSYVFIVIEMTITKGNLPTDKKLEDLLLMNGQDTSKLTKVDSLSTATKLVYGMEKSGSETATEYLVANTIQIDPSIVSDTDQEKGTTGDYQGIEFTLTFSGRAIQQNNLGEGKGLTDAYAILFDSTSSEG
ncbi:MAG: hypothetical protein IJW36_01275 [Clostridia bacterium]|nr:hypothetical protein [Clostridia bacterium]